MSGSDSWSSSAILLPQKENGRKKTEPIELQSSEEHFDNTLPGFLPLGILLCGQTHYNYTI